MCVCHVCVNGEQGEKEIVRHLWVHGVKTLSFSEFDHFLVQFIAVSFQSNKKGENRGMEMSH